MTESEILNETSPEENSKVFLMPKQLTQTNKNSHENHPDNLMMLDQSCETQQMTNEKTHN